MKKKICILVGLLLLQNEAGARSSSEKMSMGNPAARFCENTLEGRSISFKDSEGESALCDLHGARVEQWTLYRELMQKNSQVAIQVYTSLTSVELKKIQGSTLSVCKKKGGEVLSVQHEAGVLQLCRFSDGSIIELNTLSAGTEAEKNKRLTTVLGQAKDHQPATRE